MATGRKDYWLSILITESTYDIDVDVPPNQYIHGWDPDEEKWLKLVCTDQGKLIVNTGE